MDFENEKNKLAEAFAAVQNLQIKPTKDNIHILSLILHNLDEVYGTLERAKIVNQKEEEGEHAS